MESADIIGKSLVEYQARFLKSVMKKARRQRRKGASVSRVRTNSKQRRAGSRKHKRGIA